MIEPRLRAVLLGIAAAGFAGMIAELLLVEHWGLPWQITPFTLSAVAIVSIFLFALRPRVLTAVLLRLVMASVIAGAALGMYQHVAGNAAFEREIHVGASTGAVLWGALRGVAPAMAPGGLAMAALVAVAATWRSQARRGEPVAGQSS